MGVLFKIIFVVLLASFAHVVIRFLLLLDLPKHIHRHAPGPCHLVAGVEHGSEDIEIMKDGTALITAGLRFQEGHKRSPHYKDAIGRMLVFNMKKPKEGVTEVKVEGDFNMTSFSPHGISIFEDTKSGKTIVFVVNHPIDEIEDSVEKFVWNRKQKVLIHQETIQHPAFRLLNDVKAMGADKFYASNYHYSMSRVGRVFEFFGMQYWGQIVYWEKGDARVVAEDLFLANGVTTSHDNRYFYLIADVGRFLHVYERQSNNSLKLLHKHPLNTKADNLDIDEQGDLWTGAHPVGVQILFHLEDPKLPSSSQVLRMRMNGAELKGIEEVYADNGQELYGSSSAAYYNNGLLIGTVAHKLMYCDVKYIEA